MLDEGSGADNRSYKFKNVRGLKGSSSQSELSLNMGKLTRKDSDLGADST
jgi:hypothetical protein